MKLRPLKTADVFTVVGMLLRVSKTSLKEMFTSDVTSTPKNKAQVDSSQAVQIGLLILTELYQNVIEDLQKWFASLVEKTVDEYMEMPPETTLDIIDELVNGEDAKGFFSRALQLYKKMNK